MKALSIIVISFILAFTTQPLMSHIVHVQEVNSDIASHQCCGHCAGECCGDSSEESCEDTSHDCSEECTCVMDGVVVFTQSFSPEIFLFETILEKIGSTYTSYHFILPATIWHPPQATM
jgi:hypothetical protein